MNITDILLLLNDTERAKAWKFFTSLCSVITFSEAYKNKKIYNKDYINDLKKTAGNLNFLLNKNGFEAYYNIDLPNEDFEKKLIAELLTVMKNKKKPD
ncbi:MAG: hypothetical protein K0S55_2045 [Clostridia bacterium]|nr:hypothetical protein [Clostridia bacterium]